METVMLNCNHCGAGLRLPEGARFATCQYCKTQLSVHHEEGASYTAVAGALRDLGDATRDLERRTDELERQQEQSALRDELSRIEGEWQERRRELVHTNKRGDEVVPSGGLAALQALMALVFVALALASSSSMPDMSASGAGLAALVGMGLVVPAALLFGAWRTREQAAAYNDALREHEARRDEALARLER